MSQQALYNRIRVGLELEGASNITLTQMAKLMQPVATAFHEGLKVRELDETDEDAIRAGPHEMVLYEDSTVQTSATHPYSAELTLPALPLSRVRARLNGVLPVLQQHWIANASTAFQINISLEPGLTAPLTAEQLINIGLLTVLFEPILDEVHQPHRVYQPHRVGPLDQTRPNMHSSALGKDIGLDAAFARIEACLVAGDPSLTAKGLAEMLNAVTHPQLGTTTVKNFYVNFLKLQKKWVVEYRQHAGSLNLEEIEDWIEVVARIFLLALTYTTAQVNALKNYQHSLEFMKGLSLEWMEELLHASPQLRRMLARRGA
jgi:hypothetical protein